MDETSYVRGAHFVNRIAEILIAQVAVWAETASKLIRWCVLPPLGKVFVRPENRGHDLCQRLSMPSARSASTPGSGRRMNDSKVRDVCCVRGACGGNASRAADSG